MRSVAFCMFFGILLSVICFICAQDSSLPLIRWCVAGAKAEKLCWRMSLELHDSGVLDVDCIRAAHVLRCMRLIQNNLADAINLDAEHIYVAGKHFELIPALFARLKNRVPFTEDAAVVVRRGTPGNGLSALEYNRLCLGGVDTANLQHQALVNVLMPLGFMPVSRGHCESTLPSIAAYFGPSCVAGNLLNPEMASRYRSLCENCRGKNCLNPEYSGQRGVIRCLQDGKGDVGVTNSLSINESSLNPLKFERLCIQGTRQPLDHQCSWTRRPTNAIMFSSKSPKALREQWKKALLAVFFQYHYSDAPWFELLLFGPRVKSVEDVYFLDNYRRYLDVVFVRSMSTPFPWVECGRQKSFRWCVTSLNQFEHCQEFRAALQTQRLKPKIECVLAANESLCLKHVRSNQADITLGSASATIDGYLRGDLVPVASELYNDGRKVSDYLVAVVNKNSSISLRQFRGTKACLGHATDILTWNAPLFILEQRGIIRDLQCDFTTAGSAVFSKSCVPGVQLGSKHDFSVTLCALCRNLCSQTTPKRRSSLQCIRRNSDRVAFLTSDELSYLPSDRYELLCLNGQRRPLLEAHRCHWLKIPSRFLVVSPRHHDSKKRQLVTETLQQAQQRFGFLNEPNNEEGRFSMFWTLHDNGTFFGPQTSALAAVWPEEDPARIFGPQFFAIYQKVFICNHAGQTSCNGNFLMPIIILYFTYFLIC